MKNAFLTGTSIAHRGLHSKTVPENSLSAFRLAIEHGYAIETDVRLSKDGALVLFHDDDLIRTCKIDKLVSECTLEQLSRIRLEGSEEKIPTLLEFLTLVNGQVPILLEIKDVQGANRKRYLRKIAAAFDGYEGEYAVQSFHPFLIKGYKKLHPEIPCGILATALSKKSDFGNSVFWRIKAKVVKENALDFWVKPDFLSYRAEDFPQKATERFQGIKLAWTVRSYATQEIVKNYADNIIFEDFLPEI